MPHWLTTTWEKQSFDQVFKWFQTNPCFYGKLGVFKLKCFSQKRKFEEKMKKNATKILNLVELFFIYFDKIL